MENCFYVDRIWEIQRENEEKTASMILKYEKQLYEQDITEEEWHQRNHCVVEIMQRQSVHCGRDLFNRITPLRN
mgnify:CR=1 FL=1